MAKVGNLVIRRGGGRGLYSKRWAFVFEEDGGQ